MFLSYVLSSCLGIFLAFTIRTIWLATKEKDVLPFYSLKKPRNLTREHAKDRLIYAILWGVPTFMIFIAYFPYIMRKRIPMASTEIENFHIISMIIWLIFTTTQLIDPKIFKRV